MIIFIAYLLFFLPTAWRRRLGVRVRIRRRGKNEP